MHGAGNAQSSDLVTLPDATTPDAFIKWANNLPASNPPTWLGLAPNAEAALLASRGEQLLSTWQVTGQLINPCKFEFVLCDMGATANMSPGLRCVNLEPTSRCSTCQKALSMM